MRIFNLDIETTNTASFSSKIISSISKYQGVSILPATMNEIYLSGHNPNIHFKISKFTFIVPDGMPLVWLLKLSGHPKASRIYGPNLFKTICKKGQKNSLKHYFYGGNNQEILKKLINNLKISYPKIIIAGHYCPPFRKLSKLEEKKILKEISMLKPHVIWVGLGSQLQINWISQWQRKLPHTTFIAIGAAFDFISGTKKQAPYWVQQLGLEWLFRLIHEPRRLLKRYILHLPYTVYIYCKEIIKIIK